MDLKVSLGEVKLNGLLRHDQTADMFRAGMGHQTVTPWDQSALLFSLVSKVSLRHSCCGYGYGLDMAANCL